MSKDPNTVYIGRKPTMSYVLAVITSFNSSDTKEVTIKARGRAITTAVDVAEIVKRKFMKDLNTNEISTGTEEIQLEEGGTRNVSTIEIKLAQEQKPPTKKEKAKAVESTEVKGEDSKTKGKTKTKK
jgi:DNA-binding protein